MPGMPGGAGGFDFSALQQALNDPAIKQVRAFANCQFAKQPAAIQAPMAGQHSAGGFVCHLAGAFAAILLGSTHTHTQACCC